MIIPDDVTVKIEGELVIVKGPKGELKENKHPSVSIKQTDNQLEFSVKNPLDKKEGALWGTNRSIVANMVLGVTNGFEKQLEINGVGYKAALKGNDLILNVGYSHEVKYEVPEEVSVTVEKNIITISGIDKQAVGEVAAQIRKIKKPEPYKGKGIKYVDEVIRRKAGKALKGAGEGA